MLMGSASSGQSHASREVFELVDTLLNLIRRANNVVSLDEFQLPIYL